MAKGKLAEAHFRTYAALDKMQRIAKATRWTEVERAIALDAVATDLRAALKLVEAAQ